MTERKNKCNPIWPAAIEQLERVIGACTPCIAVGDWVESEVWGAWPDRVELTAASYAVMQAATSAVSEEQDD